MIYLASPYWDSDGATRDIRVSLSAKAAEWLAGQDLLVFSPLAHSAFIAAMATEKPPEAYWRRHGVAMVARCDCLAVLTLDGWNQSKGVAMEIDAARINGVSVRYLERCSSGFNWRDKHGLSGVCERQAGD